MTTAHRHVAHRPWTPVHDLAWAWVATALVAGLVATMPAVPTIAGWWGFDLEGAGYTTSVAVLAGYLLVMDLLASWAFVLGRRAVAAGHPAGRVPQVFSVVMAGFFTLLMVASLIAHLLGME